MGIEEAQVFPQEMATSHIRLRAAKTSALIAPTDPRSGLDTTYRTDIPMVRMIPSLNVETRCWNLTPSTLSVL